MLVLVCNLLCSVAHSCAHCIRCMLPKWGALFSASVWFRQNSWLTGQTLPIIPVMPIVAIAPVGSRFGPAPLNCLQVDPQHAKQPLENPSRNVAPAHLLAHDGIGAGTFSMPRRDGTVRSSAIVRK